MSKIHCILETNLLCKAGQLQKHLPEWKCITSDPFIIQCIKNCELEFDHIPFLTALQNPYTRNTNFH